MACQPLRRRPLIPSSRSLALLRAVGVTAGRSAFRRTAPFYFAVLIAAGIAFGGQGMDAADLTGLMVRSTPLRLTLWGLWLAGSAPAAQALFGEPRLFFLRSLPVPRMQVLAVHALLLLLAELPWLVLFARGQGAGAAVAITVAAMALHSLWVVRWQGRHRLLLLPLLAPLLLALALPAASLWLALASQPALLYALPRAYITAPERASHTEITFLSPRRWPPLALALSYTALLWRGQRSLLLRCLLLCLLPAGISLLAIRNNDIATLDGQNTLALGTLSIPLLLALCSLAAPILRSEAQLAWLLATSGQSGPSRVLAALLTLGLHGALLALPQSLLLWAVLRTPPVAMLRFVGTALALGLSLAAVAHACLRATQRGDAKDSDRLLLLLLAVIPLGILCCWLLHEAVVIAWAVVGLVASERVATGLLPASRFARLRAERQVRAGDDL